MTGSEIATLFAQLIGEEGDNPMDDIFTYQLMNIAKDSIEDISDWEFLKKKWTISGTTLPTDLREPIKIVVNDTFVPIRPFEDYEIYDDGYYIDYANSTINPIGSYSTSPILTYKYQTSDLTSTTEPVFPSRYHALIAYEMAFIYQAGIDGDDLSFKMSQLQLRQREVLMKQMLAWDSNLKLKNMNGITDYDYRYQSPGQTLNLNDQ